jgi:hypothetical protein
MSKCVAKKSSKANQRTNRNEFVTIKSRNAGGTTAKSDETVLDRLRKLGRDMGWACLAHTKHYHVHRCAWEIGDDYPTEEIVIFGNDGFDSDPRANHEVALLVRALDSNGIKITGFGSYQGSWALTVQHDDSELLNLLVWDAWFRACGDKQNPASRQLASINKKRNPSVVSAR